MALNANNFNQGVNDKVVERLSGGAALASVINEHGLKYLLESSVVFCNQEVVNPVAALNASYRTTYASVGTTGTAQRINPTSLTAQPDIPRSIIIVSSSASQTGDFTIAFRDCRNNQKYYTDSFTGTVAVEIHAAVKTIDYITYTGVSGETITVDMGYYMGLWMPALADFYSVFNPMVSTNYSGVSDTSFTFAAVTNGWTDTGSAIAIPNRGTTYADEIYAYAWKPPTSIAMNGSRTYRLMYPVGMADMKFINHVN